MKTYFKWSIISWDKIESKTLIQGRYKSNKFLNRLENKLI